MAGISKCQKTVSTYDNEKTNVNNKHHESVDIKNHNGITHLKDFGIAIRNATAKWTSTQTENTLQNINLTVKPGRLVAIIGSVGSGKVCTIFPKIVFFFFF